MARSLNGNLRGSAARMTLDERIDLLPVPFADRYQEAVGELRDLMGEKNFDVWYDSYPGNILKRDFLPIMQKKIAAERQLVIDNQTPPEVAAWMDDTEEYSVARNERIISSQTSVRISEYQAAIDSGKLTTAQIEHYQKALAAMRKSVFESKRRYHLLMQG